MKKMFVAVIVLFSVYAQAQIGVNSFDSEGNEMNEVIESHSKQNIVLKKMYSRLHSLKTDTQVNQYLENIYDLSGLRASVNIKFSSHYYTRAKLFIDFSSTNNSPVDQLNLNLPIMCRAINTLISDWAITNSLADGFNVEQFYNILNQLNDCIIYVDQVKKEIERVRIEKEKEESARQKKEAETLAKEKARLAEELRLSEEQQYKLENLRLEELRKEEILGQNEMQKQLIKAKALESSRQKFEAKKRIFEEEKNKEERKINNKILAPVNRSSWV